MVFGASAGCPRCCLRFAPRATCPSCGSSDVIRARGAETFRTVATSPSGPVVQLSRLAPSAPSTLFSIGLALFAPSVVMALAFGDIAFGPLLVVASLGAVVMSYVVVTTVAERHVVAQVAGRPYTVWSPADDDSARETFAGVARAATATITSPVTGEACLFCGLRGRVDGAEIADAEGGDFDLELPNGERLMVSLEHAVLVCDGPSEPRELAPDDEGFDAFLEQRGLRRRARECRVSVCAVSDGSDVVVVADVAGAAITVGGAFRAPGGRARVLAGSPDRPLVVRAVRADQSPSSRSK
ncbi:MAG: hypothetical protein U0235_03165 [Polyangiaceae bacterium]